VCPYDSSLILSPALEELVGINSLPFRFDADGLVREPSLAGLRKGKG
jgi:hypothetical protein